MSYHTECDWCVAWLAYDEDQAEMSVTIFHRKSKSRLDAQWSEETCQTCHFCASPKEATDPDGRNRSGLIPEERLDSCYDRAIAAITGTELRDPGMGMEWQLVPIVERTCPRDESGRLAAVLGSTPLAELGLEPATCTALTREGIPTVEHAADMRRRGKMPGRGVGIKRLERLDRALVERGYLGAEGRVA